jgi:hypothetical protein
MLNAAADPTSGAYLARQYGQTSIPRSSESSLLPHPVHDIRFMDFVSFLDAVGPS